MAAVSEWAKARKLERQRAYRQSEKAKANDRARAKANYHSMTEDERAAYLEKQKQRPKRVRKPLTREQKDRIAARRKDRMAHDADYLKRSRAINAKAQRKFIAANPLTNAQRDRRNYMQRKRLKLNPTKYRIWSRAEPEVAGSAYIAAAPSIGRDLLVRLAAAAPRFEDHSEIVAIAALLVVEGVPEADAIKQATREVQRQGAELRYAKPIEDCYWL